MLRYGIAHGWGVTLTVLPCGVQGTSVLRILFEGLLVRPMLYVRVTFAVWSHCMLCCLHGWTMILDLSNMPWALVGDHVCLHAGPWPRGLVHRALVPGPGCPFGSLVPARSLPLALGLGPGPGFRLCWCLFFGMAQGAALQYAACKPSICVLMLFLEPRVCVAHAGFYS